MTQILISNNRGFKGKAMKKLCVFTGAALGTDPRFAIAAHQLGQILGSRNLGLVYGGRKSGLMGKIADAVIDENGHVTGIIPKFLDNVETRHPKLSEQHVTDTMHERKNMMYEISDGFIVMPGGIGTLEEAMEVITWRQLNLHNKPIIIVNLFAYWEHMLLLFQNIVNQGFMHHENKSHFDHVDDMGELADILDRYF